MEWLEEQGAWPRPRSTTVSTTGASPGSGTGALPSPSSTATPAGPLPVPEEDLPVILPRVEDFKPDDSGISPLARVEEWYQTSALECGAAARRETDVSDTFLDSSWYFLRYPSTDRADVPMDPEITQRWLPVDCYIGGEEHAVLHLLYARFITMALKDMGHLDFEEPFTKFRKHGLIIREGAKMSKSKGNVIVPDPIIEEFGADTFRVYLMFLGPFAEGGDYRDEGIQGPFGFLHRLYDTVVSAIESADPGAPPPIAKVEQKLHKTIKQVSEQLPNLQYNTAIAAMMEYLNAVTSRRTPGGKGRGGAPGGSGRPLRSSPGRGTLGAPGPRRIRFRRSQLARLRRRESRGRYRQHRRPGEREAPGDRGGSRRNRPGRGGSPGPSPGERDPPPGRIHGDAGSSLYRTDF